MNKAEKKAYESKQPVAVYPMSNWGGLEIIAIEYGINDYAVYRESVDGVPGKLHRAVIKTTPSDRNFFIYNSARIYLDGCLRCQQ